MSYVPHTQDEIKKMLKAIGVSSLKDLFKDIKRDLRPKSFNIANGKSEFEVVEHMKKLAAKNATHLMRSCVSLSESAVRMPWSVN